MIKMSAHYVYSRCGKIANILLKYHLGLLSYDQYLKDREYIISTLIQMKYDIDHDNLIKLGGTGVEGKPW